jgi:hypothetical protein
MAAGHTARYIAMGTGTATPAISDTALATPTDLNAGKALLGTDSVSGSVKYRVTKAITAGGARTITEVGLFDVDVMTNMLYREVFTGVPVINNDTVTFTIDITVG